MYIPLKVNGQYNEDELWMAQVSLWVQSDILRAIQQTVQEGLRSGSLELKGVPASPVKRLVYIRVPGYVMKRTGMTGGGAGAPAGPVSPAAPTGVGAMQYVGGLGTLALTGTGQGQDPPHLTARACNTLHDVVHYQFRVLMPERHLLSLYRNLMLQNYHTILDVNVSQPLKGSAAGGATGRDMVGGSQGRSEEFYDYGTDPVVQVTITGELLLLADFTRGRIDPGVKGPEVGFSKDFPPLMPPLFLDRMNLADPSALRKEDGDRMRAAGLGVTPAAGPTPYGQPRRPAGEEPPIRRGGGMEAY